MQQSRIQNTEADENSPDIAVLIPCFNEALTIGDVVSSFSQSIPTAKIYVYDNNSTDQTADIARRAGAVVRHESRQGKGNVIRRMFADIDADIYIMADGDATYDAARASDLVAAMIDQNLDMVVGVRRPIDAEAAYRPGHQFGNKFLTRAVGTLFGRSFTDMLSGYRVFTRRFVKSFPAQSAGFETETEISIHALHLGMPAGEVATKYFARAEGSNSKLNTYRDGFSILLTILHLVKEYRPLAFFGVFATVLAFASVALATPLIITYLDSGIVPRLPTAILVTGMIILSSLSGLCGVILDSVCRGRLEVKRLAYLAIPAPWSKCRDSK